MKIVGNGIFDEVMGEFCVFVCIVFVCKYKFSLKYFMLKIFFDVFVEGNLISVGGVIDKMYFDLVLIYVIVDLLFDYIMNVIFECVCLNLVFDVKVGKFWNVEEDDDDDFDRVNVCEEWYCLNLELIEVIWNLECEGVNCSFFVELGYVVGGNMLFF